MTQPGAIGNYGPNEPLVPMAEPIIFAAAEDLSGTHEMWMRAVQMRRDGRDDFYAATHAYGSVEVAKAVSEYVAAQAQAIGLKERAKRLLHSPSAYPIY